ncbi:MAG: hypothetical protein KC613_24295, partial [Myxococcales bacterium]|nr:hypothetical protein [Myxococcales bacterium]
MSDAGGGKARGAFERRVALGLVVFALCSFALGLWAAMTDRGSLDPAPDGRGRSAVGHGGLLGVLEALDVPVERRRTAPTGTVGAVTLVLSPAWRDLDATARRAQAARIQALAEEGPVIVSLPRFRAVADARPDEARALRPDAEAAAHTLEVLGLAGQLAVTAAPAEGPGALPVAVHEGFQVLEGAALTPVITAGSGTLLGRRGGLWVLADPTPLMNLGLGQAANGAFAMDLLARAGVGV